MNRRVRSQLPPLRIPHRRRDAFSTPPQTPPSPLKRPSPPPYAGTPRSPRVFQYAPDDSSPRTPEFTPVPFEEEDEESEYEEGEIQEKQQLPRFHNKKEAQEYYHKMIEPQLEVVVHVMSQIQRDIGYLQEDVERLWKRMDRFMSVIEVSL